MANTPQLSPTSYALLGLLVRGPRSAYELNRLMQGSLMRVFWPRAESHVYSEPRKLLSQKLVSQRSERANGRVRKVYTLTARGRKALARWLEEEGTPELRTPSELILKLLLSSAVAPAQGRNMIEASRAASRADMEQAMAGIEQILQTPGHEEAGAPWNGIAVNLMADILIARYRWSAYALQASAALEQDTTAAAKVAMAREAYAVALEKMRDALAGDS